MNQSGYQSFSSGYVPQKITSNQATPKPGIINCFQRFNATSKNSQCPSHGNPASENKADANISEPLLISSSHPNNECQNI